MATYDFAPKFRVVRELPGVFSIPDLEAERGVYSATPRFVRQHCGPIAVSILDAVPDDYFAEAERLGLYPNIDVRIHRLYPGDYPAYPGWHCDGEFRETYFSQPDLDRIPVSHHMVATASTHPEGVSNTQFLNEPFRADVDEDAKDVTLWGQVHRQLEAKGYTSLVDTRDGQLVAFDSRTLHRAMPTKVRGWRLFFRISMWHRPNLGAGGMLTKQEQVYKVAEGTGW
jgi:hypothetical protein